MQYDTLRINWHVAADGDSSGPSLVTPLIEVNGQPLFGVAVPVVDALDVLVCSGHNGRFNLLTCSCGNPGCAGIHEEVLVQADTRGVRWNVPAPGYQEAMASSFGAGPWSFFFEPQAFAGALAKAKAELLEIERESKVTVALCPWAPWDWAEEAPPIAAVLAEAQRHHEENIRKQLCFEKSFGDLCAGSIVLRTPTRAFRMGMQPYAWAVVNALDLPLEAHSENDNATLMRAWTEAASALRANPQEAVLQLPDEVLHSYCQPEGGDRYVPDSSGVYFWRRPDCVVSVEAVPQVSPFDATEQKI